MKKTRGMKKARVKMLSMKQKCMLAMVIFALCAWVVVVTVAVQFVLSLIMYVFLGEKLDEPVWTAAYSALVYSGVLAIILLVTPRLVANFSAKVGEEKKPEMATKADLGIRGEVEWTDILLSPIAYVVGTLLAAGLVSLLSGFTWFDAGQAQSTGFEPYMNAPERIIAFITLAVIAPIAEEVIFRGWLYGRIRERLHGKVAEWAGIVISTLVVSVTFGLVHMQWNVGVNVFALSLVLCALREITGKIYAGIFTHVIKNAVAFYLLYILGFGV